MARFHQGDGGIIFQVCSPLPRAGYGPNLPTVVYLLKYPPPILLVLLLVMIDRPTLFFIRTIL